MRPKQNTLMQVGVVTALILGAIALMPFAAAGAPDPYVNSFSFLRSSGTQHTYRYDWDFNICNKGDADYTAPHIYFEYGYWNGAAAHRTEATTASPDASQIDKAGGPVLTANNGQCVDYQEHVESDDFYCCGYVDVTVSGGQDSDGGNNFLTANSHVLVMHASQTRTQRIALLNPSANSQSFSNSVTGVPTGWTVALSESSTTVAGEWGVNYFNATITAPSSISIWPDIVISSVPASHRGDQQSTVSVRFDGTNSDACGGMAL